MTLTTPDHVALAGRLLAAQEPWRDPSAAARLGNQLGAAVDGVALKVVARIFLASHRRGVDQGPGSAPRRAA